MLAADDLEPLILADGTKINPTTGKAIKEKKSSFVEVPMRSEAQALIVKARKSMNELPLPPEKLTGVALVAFYTLFGLPDIEIALACDNKITTEQITKIRELDAYKEFMVTAKTNILETEQNAVRDIFQKNATGAATKIVSIAVEDDGVLGFKASQDILDRAGHRPADIVEHRHKMEDALQIVVTHKRADDEVPTLEGDFSVMEPDNVDNS